MHNPIKTTLAATLAAAFIYDNYFKKDYCFQICMDPKALDKLNDIVLSTHEMFHGLYHLKLIKPFTISNLKTELTKRKIPYRSIKFIDNQKPILTSTLKR